MGENAKIIGKEYLVGIFLKQYIGNVAYKSRLNSNTQTFTIQPLKRVCLEQNQFMELPTFYAYKFP